MYVTHINLYSLLGLRLDLHLDCLIGMLNTLSERESWQSYQ